MENTQEENVELFKISSMNQTSYLKFFGWVLNSPMDSDLQVIPMKKHNELDVVAEVTTHQYNSTTINYFDNHNADSLSIMWYLASFGALVMFFLLISFSEVCCKKSYSVPPEDEVEVSPPPYDLFAPPSYESIYEEKTEKSHKTKKKRRKFEIFVIPVFGEKTSARVAPLDAIQRHNMAEGDQIRNPPAPP